MKTKLFTKLSTLSTKLCVRGDVFLRSPTPVLIGFFLLYVALVNYVLLEFLIASHFGDALPRAKLAAMMNGTAFRPFVFRTLVPTLVQCITYITPGFIQDGVAGLLSDSNLSDILMDFSHPPRLINGVFGHPEMLYPRAVMTVILYAVLWGYLFCLYKLAEFFYPGQWAMALVAPVVGMVMLLGFMHPAAPHIYDFPLLFLTSACYYCMAKRRWDWYIFWFLLAAINKESTVFILIFFVIWHGPRRVMQDAELRMLAIVQSIILGVVKLALFYIFRNSPGWFLEFHPQRQLGAWLGGMNFRDCIIYFMLVFILIHQWREKPPFVRTILYLFPLMYIAYFWFGFRGEYRVFFDLFPLMALLITDTLVVRTGIAQSRLFNRPEWEQAP